MDLIQNQKGKFYLVNKGYLFVKDKDLSDGRSFWKCKEWPTPRIFSSFPRIMAIISSMISLWALPTISLSENARSIYTSSIDTSDTFEIFGFRFDFTFSNVFSYSYCYLFRFIRFLLLLKLCFCNIKKMRLSRF